MAEIKTFGEFWEQANDWARQNDNMEAALIMEEWRSLVSAERWSECLSMEFTEDLFVAFGEDMATYFRERICGIYTDALWMRVIKSGHDFLVAITSIAKSFGVIAEVDAPLSFGDALIRASGARQER